MNNWGPYFHQNDLNNGKLNAIISVIGKRLFCLAERTSFDSKIIDNNGVQELSNVKRFLFSGMTLIKLTLIVKFLSLK